MEEITTPTATEADPGPAPEATPEADPAPAGDGADGSGSISLKEISEVLGKDFKDPEGALKSIKDTFNYVGGQAQYKENIEKLSSALGTDEAGVLSTLENLIMSLEQGNENPTPKVEPTPEPQPQGNYVTREEMDENNFFGAHPELADLKDVLGPMKEVHGQDMSWNDFAQTDQAKKVIDPITGFREIEQQKSALESNPRLGAVTDTMSKSRESMAAANEAARSGDRQTAVQHENAAREAAVSGVIEAFDIR